MSALNLTQHTLTSRYEKYRNKLKARYVAGQCRFFSCPSPRGKGARCLTHTRQAVERNRRRRKAGESKTKGSRTPYCKVKSCRSTDDLFICDRYKRQDGTVTLYYMCRSCNNKHCKRWQHTPKGKNALLEQNRRQLIVNKHKVKARRAVRQALLQGKLERRPCETCGDRAQAHHEDYARPLDVQWLCSRHHAEAHSRSK